MFATVCIGLSANVLLLFARNSIHIRTTNTHTYIDTHEATNKRVRMCCVQSVLLTAAFRVCRFSVVRSFLIKWAQICVTLHENKLNMVKMKPTETD